MNDKVLYSITEFAKAHGLGRSTVYRLLREGGLTARKVGKRTVITAADASEWRESLTSYKPTATSQASVGDAPAGGG